MNVVSVLMLLVLSVPAFARQGAPVVNEKDLKRQRQTV